MMKKLDILAIALLVGALALLSPISVGAQQTAPKAAEAEEGTEGDDSQGLFLERINVNVVNIDVYVTDKKGNPIKGLTKDDFEIFENKRPMAITNFYAVEEGETVAGAPEVVETEEPQRPRLPFEERDIPEDQRLYLVVFIDNFNIRPFNRNRVMREVRQFLNSTLRREDRVMLVSYTRSMKIEQPFTNDPRLIGAGLAKLEKHTGHAVLGDSARRDVMERVEESQDEFEAIGHARMYAESVYNDLSFTLSALKEFVNSLAGLPGRKAILHVSDGIPMVPGEAVFHFIEAKFQRTTAITEAFSYNAGRRFTELTALANSNRVTFYTIDAAGLRTYDYVSAENAGVGERNSPYIENIRVHNYQNTLHMLADQTGGQAIVNRNRVLPALQEVARDLRNFYSLGFSPPHAGDGRLYDIKVKVKGRKDLRLRYRDNYRDKTVETRMADGTMAALQYAYYENSMNITLEFGEAKRREQNRHFVVPIRVRIPLGEVTLIPYEANSQSQLRLYVAAIDEEGDTSPVQEVPLPISIPLDQVEQAKTQDFVYTIELIMRRGSHKVAVGVRDDLGSDTSFVTRQVRVGA